MPTPEERLAALGLSLPSAPAPAAAYVPVTRAGEWVFTAGQIPVVNGRPTATGKVGAEVDFDSAVAAARTCALNVLAQLKAAAGDLSRVTQVVKVTVYVASAPSFTRQHEVANGASALLGEVLGDAGAHARAAVGVAALPLDVPVEVDAIARVQT